MKYFLHDSNSFQDEKITELYINFGYEGVGLFYTILERIALQEKPIKTDVLKRQLNIGKRLDKCWNFMQQIDLIQVKNGETFNENILNFSEKYQIKKEKNRKKISEWRESQKDTENVTDYVTKCNRPKLKKTKLKKTKVNLPEGTPVSENGNSLHADSIKIYCEWYDKKVGIKYPFQGGLDGVAMKTILINLRGAITEKNDEPAADEKILDLWKLILDNYDKWESFYQAQLKLSQISSNLANIYLNIKGIKKDGKFNTAEQGRLTPEDWEALGKVWNAK